MSGMIGIDPGFKGGIAVVGSGGKLLVTAQMPVKRRQVSRRWRTTMDLSGLCRLFDNVQADFGISAVLIENVHASPQMGVSSSFNFGRGFGGIEGVMSARGFTVRYVEPGVWKAVMGLSADKKRSLVVFEDIFKQAEKYEGIAEAALLAWYGVKKMNLKEEDPLS